MLPSSTLITSSRCFFPEKRPFFLQDANIFSSPMNLVYTRNISDPDLGLKLTGKQGAHTYGLFAAADRVTSLLFPGSQGSDVTLLEQSSEAVVARYRRDFGKNSAAGCCSPAVTQTGTTITWPPWMDCGGSMTRTALSFSYSVPAPSIRTPWSLNLISLPARFRVRATSYAIDTAGATGAGLRAMKNSTMSFRADMGFLPRNGYDTTVAGLGRVWHGGGKKWWRSFEISGDWDITHDSSGRVLEREVEGDIELAGPLQSFVETGGGYRQRYWDGVLFDEDFRYFYGEFRPADGVFLGFYGRVGDQIDFDNTRLGDFTSISPRFSWDLGDHLRMNLRHTSDTLDTQDGRMIYKARLNDFRFTWQFTIRSFLRMTVQHLNLSRDPSLYVEDVDAQYKSLGAQLLYSYKVNPQTVFFLGYSDSFVDDDRLTGFERSDRTLFTKIGYAWLPD